jgi:fibronectin type 3 domain-containing protein
VAYCQLLRRSQYQSQWTILNTWSSQDSLNNYLQYIDTSVSSNEKYWYWLKVTDEYGKHSDPRAALEIACLKNYQAPEVKNLQLIASPANQMIKITWQYPSTAHSFKIYRQADKQNLVHYATIAGNQREYYDTYIKPGTNYKYFVKALTKQNAQSTLAGPVEVNY